MHFKLKIIEIMLIYLFLISIFLGFREAGQLTC